MLYPCYNLVEGLPLLYCVYFFNLVLFSKCKYRVAESVVKNSDKLLKKRLQIRVRGARHDLPPI